MLRYAITSRTLFPGDDHDQLEALVRQAADWAKAGIDFIQLREKNLTPLALAALARRLLQTIQDAGSSAKLLVNSRADVALATTAHGVHLTSAPGELTPAQIRHLYASAALPAPLITISCHTIPEIQQARENHVDAILFGPVFGKSVSGSLISPGQGLEALRAACQAASPTPIYALGGVTLQNAAQCIEAGASGVAGIRLFHTT